MNAYRPEPAAMTRQQLGALAAPLYPIQWADALQIETGWSESTIRRLGRHPRFPITERRVENMAAMLEQAETFPDASKQLAARLRSFLSDGNPAVPGERNGEG